MSRLASFLVIVLVLTMAAGDALAQGRRRGGFGGRMGGRQASKVMLLGVDAVAADISLTDGQKDQIASVLDEMRGGRGDRPNFREMPEDERQEAIQQMRSEARERQKEVDAKLAEILDTSQMERLNQITIQVQGPMALMNPEVQQELGLTAETIEQLTATSREVVEGMRDKMGEMFRNGDRSNMREEMAMLREQSNEQILALLSGSERQAFTKMQGDKIDINPGDLRGGRRGGGRQERQGGPGSGRPRDEGRPELE